MQKIRYLILALLCAVAQGAWAQTWTEVGDKDALNNAVTTNGANIRLTADIALSEKLEIGNGKTVTIDLNGHTLSRSLDANVNYGMVIYVNGGNLTINDSSGNNGSIEGGRSYNGAGILCESGSKLTINGGTFTNNDTSRTDNGNHGRGGAIFMNPNTTLTVTGGKFENNSAYNGGAIYIDDGGPNGGTPASATISGAAISNNTASGDGGAIYNNGTLTVSNCTISGNTASNNGGGIFIYSGSTISMSGNPVITDNTVDDKKNNLYLDGSNTKITCGTFTEDANISVSVSNYNRTITSNYINSENPDKYLHPDALGATILRSGGEAYIKLTVFEVSTENELNDAISGNSQVYSIKLTADVTLSEKFTISSSKTVELDLNGHKLSRSLTENETYGMVIYVNGGNLIIKDSSGNNSGSIEGGRSYNGGGILCESGSTLTITGGTFRNNDVSRTDNGSHGRGGAIFMNPSTTLIVTGGVFENNEAYQGGAIYIDKSVTASLQNFTITNNTASEAGGGIYTKSNFGLSGSVTITDNKVGSSANNLFLGGSTVINVTDAFESGTSIGITLDGYDRDFTSGFSRNNSNAQPSDFFSSDIDNVELSLNDNEAKLTIISGLIYIERAWEGSNTDGHVMDKKKICSSYTTYNNEKELFGGWYLLSGNNTYNTRIIISGDVKFILADGSDTEFKQGIRSCNGSTLTIYAQEGDTGKLRATGSGDAANAAIGGSKNKRGGSLVIHGGTIEAKSSKNNAAGIGGGDGEDSGMQNITIYGGTVTATGESSGAGIGGGQENKDANCPTIKIYNGSVTATGGEYAAGIGSGEETKSGSIYIYGGNVKATGGDHGAGIGGGEDADCGTVTIYGGTVTANGGDCAAAIGGSDTSKGGTVTIYGGRVTAIADMEGIGIGGKESATVNIHGGTVEACGNTSNSGGVGIGVKSGTLYFNMTGGDVTAKIDDKSLDGNLYGKGGAGIGGGSGENVLLYITIDGGTVKATGTHGGAGIGAGCGSNHFGGDIKSGSKITINGGTVTAIGGENGAGIGSGYGGNNKGIITINGGTVEATGMVGGAGIGGGGEDGWYVGGEGGTIIINGGKVTANASGTNENDHSQAIGNGINEEDEGSLTIADNMCVKYDGNTASSSERVDRCRDHGKRTVEVCEHSGHCTDKNDGANHTVNCTYCLKKGSEVHTYASDGHTCTRCGYVMSDPKTVTIYMANSDGNGYGDATTHTMQYGTTYTLPKCSSVPDNMLFKGWKEANAEPSDIEVEDSELASLTAADTEITVTEDITYYARYQSTIWPGGGNGTVSDPYIISTEEHWNTLASNVKNRNIGFSGKYFMLDADISVSEMVGTSSTSFCGNFDGGGHTLTFNLTATENLCAPFRYIGGATIRNLVVDGSITGGNYKQLAGLAGSISGTNDITNCQVKTAITSSFSGDSSIGGIVVEETSGTTNISGCVFTGSFDCPNAYNVGGLVGWLTNATLNLKDCLFNPSSVIFADNENNYPLVRPANNGNETKTITNCYYIEVIHEGNGQGEKAYTVTSGTEGLTLDYGEGAIYGYDGIEAYSFDLGNDQTAGGLLYQNKLYTGSGTKVAFTPKTDNGKEVSSLSVSGGTLVNNDDNTYTLTMDSQNVTITATLSNYAITLYDIPSAGGGSVAATNAETLSDNHRRIADVTLDGRTLFKDGSWNTLCLPFDFTAEQISQNEDFAGATIMELDVDGTYTDDNGDHQTGFDASTSTLYLYFKEATEMEAGKPYLVRWDDNGTSFTPTFYFSKIRGFEPDVVESADGKVSFVGIYDPMSIGEGGDNTKLYLGADNNLYYPKGKMDINSFRAYFQLNGVTAGDITQGGNIHAFVLNFGDESSTGIVSLSDKSDKSDGWFSLSGMKLSGKPKAKGIYIHRGKKRVIK